MGDLMRTDFLNEESVTPVVLLHTMYRHISVVIHSRLLHARVLHLKHVNLPKLS